MEPNRHITRLLHDEHQGTLTVLNRLDGLLGDYGPKRAPDAADPNTRTLLNDVATVIGGEIGPHFAFEESELFPRLADFGDAGIGEFLKEEHDAMLPVGNEVADMARNAAQGGFDGESWGRFQRLAAELIERMMSHIQKEEMGLLPVLDDMLDDDTDNDLTNAYLTTK